MDAQEAKDIIGKPQSARLKALAEGIRVNRVNGTRLLVKTVAPHTDLDRVEKEGKLFIPDSIKQANTPIPSTGIVVLLGEAFYTNADAQKLNLDRGGNPIVEEGSMVLFSKFAGSDQRIQNEDFRIMDITEVLCTLTPVDDRAIALVKDA